MDVVFAIGATARDAQQTFGMMKEVIKSIFEKHGVDNIRPAIIVFGDRASVRMNFQEDLDLDALMQRVEGLTRNRRTPDLEEVLLEAKALFLEARPRAKKVLVIIADDRSDSRSWKIKSSAQELEENEVDIIPVGIGPNVDMTQLVVTTSHKQNTIVAKKDDDVEDLADKIVDSLLKSK